MDEGTTLEQTARVAREMPPRCARTGSDRLPGVRRHGGAVQLQRAGASYYLRRGPNVADIQVNLVGKHERRAQSHDIAKRVRPSRPGHRGEVRRAGENRRSAAWSAGVADIGGGDLRAGYQQQIETARKVLAIFKSTPGVVDADWYMEADQPKTVLRIDHEKAALNSISAEQIAQALRIAEDGWKPVCCISRRRRRTSRSRFGLPVAQRSRLNDLLALPICAA